MRLKRCFGSCSCSSSLSIVIQNAIFRVGTGSVATLTSSAFMNLRLLARARPMVEPAALCRADRGGRWVAQTAFAPMAKSKDRCPVLALHEWLQLVGITAGLLFRQVSCHDYLTCEKGALRRRPWPKWSGLLSGLRRERDFWTVAAYLLRSGMLKESARRLAYR